MSHRLATHLAFLAVAAALVAAPASSVWAQTGATPTPPAQKTPAKPGAQAGPNAAAASAASGSTSSPPAEKKPAKPGAQSGPNASGPAR